MDGLNRGKEYFGGIDRVRGEEGEWARVDVGCGPRKHGPPTAVGQQVRRGGEHVLSPGSLQEVWARGGEPAEEQRSQGRRGRAAPPGPFLTVESEDSVEQTPCPSESSPS